MGKRREDEGNGKEERAGDRTNQSIEEVDEPTSFVLHGDSDGRDVGDEGGGVGGGYTDV